MRSQSHRNLRRLAAGACSVVVATSAAVAGPGAKRADGTTPPGAAGQWAFHLDVKAGAAPEQNIGVFDLRPDGTCIVRMRSNFAGAPHDHEATTCSWRNRAAGDVGREALDGWVTVTGVAEPGPTVISFVLADRGERMLLMLDDTVPGVLGIGEAFRR